MLPSVIGDEATRRGMLWYTLGLVPVTLAPVALGLLGADLPRGRDRHERLVRRVGAAPAARAHADEAARRVFRVSLAYLFSLFVAMNVELLAR